MLEPLEHPVSFSASTVHVPDGCSATVAANVPIRIGRYRDGARITPGTTQKLSAREVRGGIEVATLRNGIEGTVWVSLRSRA